ncbi:MAG: outer membrane beta-barrel protein [Hyphomicrobiaceae bacterium]
MKTALKAGFASAALVAIACTSTGAFAADMYRGGSMKDGYVAPAPVAAGPCYFRADVGYSLSRDPTATWPVNNITRTWDDDLSNYPGATHPKDGVYGGNQTNQTSTAFVGDDVANEKLGNAWLGEVGIGCGSGSRGLRGELVLGYRGKRKFDGEPHDFTITDIYPNDPNGNTPVTDDPMHTSLSTYTLMLNGYYDLGNWHGFVPYVGAGIGVAYHRMSGVYFTGNPFLTNTIEGNNDLSFAWSVMAGVAYQISPRAVIDFGYRYIDMGKATSGRIDSAGYANPRVNIDDIVAHEFKVGLRYHFGTSGGCCTETVAYK